MHLIESTEKRDKKTLVIFSCHNTSGLASFLEKTIGTLTSGVNQIEFAYERTCANHNHLDNRILELTNGISYLNESIGALSRECQGASNQSIKTLKQSQLEVEKYMLACRQQDRAICQALKKANTPTTFFDVDSYLAKEINEHPELLGISHRLLHDCNVFRNDHMAHNILSKRAALPNKTLQIVTIGPAHYEVMYELIVKKGYSYIEKNFCFIYIYDNQFCHFFQKTESTHYSLSPFKFLLFKENETNDSSLQRNLLQLLADDNSYLGERSQDIANQYQNALFKFKQQKVPTDRTIRRMAIILSVIGKNTSLIGNLDRNLLFHLIINIWGRIDARNLASSDTVSVQKFMDLPQQELGRYEKAFNIILRKSIQEMHSANLYDTIDQGEFSRQPNAKFSGMAIPMRQALGNSQFSCERFFKSVIPVLVIGIGLMIVTAETFYAQNNLQDL